MGGGGLGGESVCNEVLFDELLTEASTLITHKEWEVFKHKLNSVKSMEVSLENRSMIAHEVFNSSFGNGAGKGLTKTDIKKALTPNKALAVDDKKIDIAEWAKEWVYVQIPDTFYNRRKGYSMRPTALNATYSREADVIISEKPAVIVALTDYQIPVVVNTMFYPGEKGIFTWEGMRMVNTYKERGVVHWPLDKEIDEDGLGVINIFLKHLELLVKDEVERTIILDWLSFVVRSPGKRVKWAIVLQGDYGNGKSYLGRVLQWCLGSMASIINGNMFASKFSSWATGSLVAIVEEIVIKNKDKYETLNMMKPLITNDVIQVEEKGKDSRNVPNFTSYFLLTNHRDAIPLDDGDRRYCVVYSEAHGGDGVYFDKLFTQTERRADAISWFLKTRTLSKSFDPYGRAPSTVAKKIMVGAAKSENLLTLEDFIEQYKCEIINENIIDVTKLRESCETQAEKLPSQKRISSILMNELGYSLINDHDNRVRITADKVIRAYIKNIDREEACTIIKNYYKKYESNGFEEA